MGSEIRHFKEKVNAIPIPEQKLNHAISNTISSSKRNSRKTKRVSYVFAAASTIFVLLFGSAFVSPAMAKFLIQVPLFGSVLSYFDVGLEEASKNGLVTKVGATSIDKDIPVTITEVYYDNFRLVIGYSVPISDHVDDVDALGTEFNILIDDKEVLGMSGHGTVKDDLLLGTIETTSKLPESFTLKVNFNEVLDKKGNWNFELPVSKNSSAYAYDINKIKETEQYKFELFNIQLAPSGTKIYMELDTPINQEVYYDFRLYNSKGDSLEFIDEEKKTIPLVNFDKEVVKTNALYEPLHDHLITLVPVFYENGDEIEMEELAIDVDLSTVKGKEIKHDTDSYGLREYKVNEDTFYRDYMLDEAAGALGIELGEYMKADLIILSFGFIADFQEELETTGEKVIEPTALVKEDHYSTGFIIYKTEDGINHVYTVRKEGGTNDEPDLQEIKGDWEITDHQSIQGKTLVEMKEIYNKK
ncbi:DUF4179 domain-containing protein [Paucisalibacillus sp. EB02]|uniref:DUF4179 domain-containing protein n=1 Tax=Paucisalibacillus sp. EB02 TaxID=1347087 RepID=UPI0005A974FC|nr:DUF4179 domain-containing protein [Paucisalibacillus sp. EB02]